MRKEFTIVFDDAEEEPASGTVACIRLAGGKTVRLELVIENAETDGDPSAIGSAHRDILTNIRKGDIVEIGGLKFLVIDGNDGDAIHRIVYLGSLGNMRWDDAVEAAKSPDSIPYKVLTEAGYKVSDASLMTRDEAQELRQSERQTLYGAAGDCIWLATAYNDSCEYCIANGSVSYGYVGYSCAAVPAFTISR